MSILPGAILILVNTYYLAFVIGMLLSDLYNGKNGDRYRVKNPVILGELCVVGLLFGTYYVGGWWGTTAYDTLSGVLHFSIVDPSMFFRTVGAGILLLVLLNSGTLKNLLNSRVSVFLGRILYTMYLLHILVVYPLSSLLFTALAGMLDYHAAVLITLAVSLPVVLSVAYLATLYVDEPGIRLSKRIYERYFMGEPGAMEWDLP
ncbi:acyltransferase family protein [Methanocella conradii]|uniref:acyltransferase family protein n=1 Tax=Methanocella conradii TaxID=1175444 RepID=UPI00157C0704|nr:acyltransferase [Methanocella conradii]